MLDVAHAALRLALGPSSVRRTRLRLDPPVLAERQEHWIEGHLTGLPVVLEDQRLRVVHEQLGRHTAEVLEGELETPEPLRLPLTRPRADEDSAGVAQRHHGQVDQRLAPANHHRHLPEVDLELTSRRSLEADRGLGLGQQLLPEWLHGPLNGPQRDLDPVLTRKLTLHDDSVPAVFPELCSEPGLVTLEALDPIRPLVRRPAALADVVLHGVARDPQLSGDPSRTQPSWCRRPIATTSSGVFISCLRGAVYARGSGFVVVGMDLSSGWRRGGILHVVRGSVLRVA